MPTSALFDSHPLATTNLDLWFTVRNQPPELEKLLRRLCLFITVWNGNRQSRIIRPGSILEYHLQASKFPRDFFGPRLSRPITKKFFSDDFSFSCEKLKLVEKTNRHEKWSVASRQNDFGTILENVSMSRIGRNSFMTSEGPENGRPSPPGSSSSSSAYSFRMGS